MVMEKYGHRTASTDSAGPGRRHPGFTATELVTVVAVLSLMMTILLPRLLQAQRTARLVKCQNNLRQIGLALAHYESVVLCLPPGCVNETSPIFPEPEGYHLGWLFQLTVYLEEYNLYTIVDQDVGAYSMSPSQIRTSGTFSTLICGAAPESVRFQPAYGGCVGGTSRQIDQTGTGLLFLNSSIRNRDIEDGRSCTIVAGEIRPSETLKQRGLTWLTGTAATLRSAGMPLNASDDDLYAPDDPRIGGFGSWHDGIVPLLMADGAVSVRSEHISPEVLQALGDRADERLIPTDDARHRQRQRSLDRLRGEW